MVQSLGSRIRLTGELQVAKEWLRGLWEFAVEGLGALLALV